MHACKRKEKNDTSPIITYESTLQNGTCPLDLKNHLPNTLIPLSREIESDMVRGVPHQTYPREHWDIQRSKTRRIHTAFVDMLAYDHINLTTRGIGHTNGNKTNKANSRVIGLDTYKPACCNTRYVWL